MKLKLIKGRSYNAKGVKATAKQPFFVTENKKLADMLVKSGHFIVVEESVKPAGNNSGGGSEVKETPLEKMTTAQLEAYAKEKGIDLTGATKNAERISKIQEAVKKPPENTGGGDSNNIDMTGEV